MMNKVMPLYFYTNPLCAAWMAKRFSMRFLMDTLDGELIEIGVESWMRQIQDLFFSLKDNPRPIFRSYVHSESLYLIEPREGDIGINMDGDVGKFYDWYGWEIKMGGNVEIVMRNGVHFYWPENNDMPEDMRIKISGGCETYDLVEGKIKCPSK